jgi:glycosyltransferase involved in cell wall biosynthesis
MKQRVFISNAIDEEKLPFIPCDKIKFGKSHYSWKIVANLYSTGLEAAGLDTQRIIRPEIYQTKIAQKVFGLEHNDIHLAVKPIDHIRSFYGMKNIYVCGWEFPEFSDFPYESNPLFNQLAILKKADQIWCWSDFTRKNLEAYGINSALTMPPPAIFPPNTSHNFTDDNVLNIPTLSLNTEKEPTIDDVRLLKDIVNHYDKDTIFFTVLNPFDKRKQLKLMLTAFQLALDKNERMILIVKLIIDNEATTLGNIQEILRIHYDFVGNNKRIIFIGDTLSDVQMNSLIRKAHFYFCTSSTEGLNLPLIESMGQGLVPVSPRTTAMLDYINEKNSIIIKNHVVKTDGAYHFLHNYLSTTHFPPILDDVVNSLLKASKTSKYEYQLRSNQAIKDVYARYSLPAFVDRLSLIGSEL